MNPVHTVVCIKPVPDARYWDRLKLDPKSKLLVREGIPITIGPLDKNALEEALQIREERGGRITVLSMGPPNTQEILKSALALGADEAILLSDRVFAGADTLATAYVLAAAIEKLGKVDLILLGNESLDGSTAQVGPQIAEFLDLPVITRVRRIEFADEKTLHVTSHLGEEYMKIKTCLPVVLAVSGQINQVRLPSVFGALWATERKTSQWACADLGTDGNQCGLVGSPTWVPEVTAIEMKRRGEVIKGEAIEIARQLIRKLRADGVLPEFIKEA